MEILVIGSIGIIAFLAWVYIDRRRNNSYKEYVERKTNSEPEPVAVKTVRKTVDPETSKPIPRWRQKQLDEKNKAMQKKAPKAKVKQTVARLERMRDRYRNAGDTRNVTVVNQYIQQANDPLTTLLQLEMIESLFNSQPVTSGYSSSPVYQQQDSGGNFGGGGAGGQWNDSSPRSSSSDWDGPSASSSGSSDWGSSRDNS